MASTIRTSTRVMPRLRARRRAAPRRVIVMVRDRACFILRSPYPTRSGSPGGGSLRVLLVFLLLGGFPADDVVAAALLLVGAVGDDVDRAVLARADDEEL